MSAGRFLRTVSHLRAPQIGWRLRYSLQRRIDERHGAGLERALRRCAARVEWDASCPPVFDPTTEHLSAPETLALLPQGKLRFLHTELPFAGGDDWAMCGAHTQHRLWTANLHYHGWLLALARQDGAQAQRFLLDWIKNCPPGRRGFADFPWNSYNLATRLRCWCQMLWLRPEWRPLLLESLAMQAAYLHAHLERDLRANHLLRDAVGLAYAGRCCSGPAAQRWLQTATRLAAEQVGEQVLPDGGHFERSPTYHIEVMDDVCVLAQLLRDDPAVANLKAAWALMAEFLAWARHPDGQIPLFNDAGFNGSSRPDEALACAPRLALAADAGPRRGGRHFSETGLVAWHGAPWTVFFDVGPLGPDYQPGHGHADTLTLECSHGARRLFVDSGTFAYDDDARRRYDRGTEAHNTVCVDGRDSSEVWHIFRVGRRARPLAVSAAFSADGFTARGAHDGYDWLPGRPRHSREVSVAGGALRIVDRVSGGGPQALSGGWLVEPGWQAEAAAGGWRVRREGRELRVTITGPEGLQFNAEPRPYHPEYGLELNTTRLCWRLSGAKLPVEVTTTVE